MKAFEYIPCQQLRFWDLPKQCFNQKDDQILKKIVFGFEYNLNNVVVQCQI